MASHDEISWAYRLLLGREPRSEELYAAQGRAINVEALRRALIGSEEGQYRLGAALREARPPIHFDYYRPLLVFLHIEKTAGTSLYGMLDQAFPRDRCSDPHLSRIPCYSLGELNQFDFIAGHFTWQEAMALPRAAKTCVALFRDPRERLISFYRFQRAHPPEHSPSSLTRLAQEHEAVDFFRHELVRTHNRIFNTYVHVLAGLPDRPEERTPDAMAARCDLAIHRVGELAAVGITGDMAGSVRLMYDQIGRAPPVEIRQLQVTAELHRETPRFRPAPPIALSAALDEAIVPLIEHDLKIYAHACRRFDADLARLDRREGFAAQRRAARRMARRVVRFIGYPVRHWHATVNRPG